MFVTMFYAVFDPATGKLVYANGGHNPPIIVRPDGSSTVPPQTDGIALGIMPDVDFAQNEITLSPGDILVLYTDGVTEAMNSRGEEFEMDRLRAVFAAAQWDDARRANQAVFDAVHAFCGRNAAV